MELQQLLGFYHTAKLGSFTKAAEATFRTQSALSQQISTLERELKTPLFERIGKKHLALTPAGKRLLAFAETLFTQYRDTLNDIAAISRTGSGRLTVAAPFTTLYHVFPARIQKYRTAHPAVDITVFDRPQAEVIAMVKSGEADIGIASESAVEKHVVARRWKRLETVLMTPPGHPLTKCAPVTAADLARYPLILPPKDDKHPARRTIDAVLAKTGADYRVVMESSNVELSSIYVESGFGIAFATVVSGLSVLRGRRLAFVPLPRLFKPDHLAIVTAAHRKLPGHIQAFIDMLIAS